MHAAERRTGPLAVTGTLAFLFTDIAGSTRLWEQLPQAMKAALARHDAILREAIEAQAGQVVKTTGDGMMAVFPTAADAVAAAIAAQRALGAEPWSDTGPLRVRMGLHAGDAELRGDDYFGPTVNRTARIMSAGHGGQVLLSAAAAALAADRLPGGATLRDLGEYRLKDLGRPERVYQLVHPDLVATFPPLAALDHGAGNLPVQAGPFVGRRVELAEIGRRLDDPSVRLLTLTGPGGTGKTSLGIRAAGGRADRFRDGVSFVDLSAARDTDAVLLALGRALGVGEAPDRPLRQELTDRLRDRQVLLVLDNFEQVTEAAATTAELLGECPELKLLVTSREPLHVRLEHVYPVPPLGLPPVARGRVSADQLEQFEAVQLFVERARAIRPDFALTDDNAAAVGDICRRLDGLPLAIELAAARLRLFSPEALRDRLDSRLELLRSTARDLPERQQTLRATIDWSYQLLAPSEQRLFETLAVFADADIEAVEAVVAATGGQAGAGVDVVEGLASLLEKSLVRQVEASQSEPRVAMLETIRDFAAERLDEHGDGATARRAHATYYAGLAAGLRRDLVGVERDRAMATMAVEAENLRDAWRCWVGEGDLGRLTQLADPLLVLNDARGWYHDTVVLTTDLLGVLAGMTSTPELLGQEIALRTSLARALMATQGFTPEVAEAYTSALRLFEAGGEVRQHYSLLRALANLYMLQADFDKARQLGDGILEFAELEDDEAMRTDGHLVLGAALAFGGDIGAGLRHLDTAIATFGTSPARAYGSRLGNDPRVACLTTAGFALWLAGRPDTAVERASAAIELARQLDHPFTLAFAHFHSGLLHAWRGEPEIVLDRAVRLLEIADEYEFRIWSAIGACLLGWAETALGRAESGLARMTEGLAAYNGLVAPPVFWPLLVFLEAGAQYRAGLFGAGLASIDASIAQMGGVTDGSIQPEIHLLRGDLLAGLEATGDVPPGSSGDVYRDVLEGARAVGARTTELRTATRLCRGASGEERATLAAELRAILATFSEGADTLDLREAAEALEAASAR